MKIAVVGGGITGLAAAWELATTAPGVTVEVHERADRLGGKIHTTPFAGRLVDEGPDAFLVRLPAVMDLVRELGLEDQVVHPAERRAYLWSRGELRPLPARHVLGVPTDLDDLAATGLLTTEELAETDRAMSVPSRPVEGDDVSVATLVGDAVGRPALERVTAPLLGGINAGDVDDMSAALLAPQLLAAGRHADGLLAGLRAQQAAADPDAPIFGAFRGGLGVLADALVEGLRERGVTFHLGERVRGLGHLDADGTVLALPAHAATDLLADAGPGAAALLNTIAYASVVLVTFAVPAAAVDRPLDASGFLVPRPEGLLMTACSWASTKWAHLGEDDTVVLRASAGSGGDDRARHLHEDELVHTLWGELATTMGVRGEPAEVRVSPWPESLPQYQVGHAALVADIEDTLAAEHPAVALAGAAYHGVGLPACVADGRAAARRLLAALGG